MLRVGPLGTLASRTDRTRWPCECSAHSVGLQGLKIEISMGTVTAKTTWSTVRAAAFHRVCQIN